MKDLERLTKVLQEKHEDQKTTLSINSDLLDVTLERKKTKMAPSDRATIGAAQEKIKVLAEIQEKLLRQNFALNDQKLDCEFAIETEAFRRRDETADLENKNSSLTAMWNEKEKKLEHLQTALKSKQKRAQGLGPVQEMSVVEPTQQTMVMHNELQINRTASSKLSRKMTLEARRRDSMLKYNKRLKQRNDQLKAILKNVINSAGGLTGNLSDKGANVDMEKIRAILENELTESIEGVEEDMKKADTSMILPQKTVEGADEAEVELSVASSIGQSMPVKNDLSCSHDLIKARIPMLDFSKIKGRSDLKKKPEEKQRATMGEPAYVSS